MTAQVPLRLGVVGLGRAFMLMLPTFTAHPRVTLVAASDPREDARRQFEAEFSGRAYQTIESMCADGNVDAVYVATPHELHAEHVTTAARYGKHALVEKPMAITLAECKTMIDATRAAKVTLLVGHSHSFDAPFVRARQRITSGIYGRVRMIMALNYTDFLYRPRRPEELDTAKGGGVVFSQGAHQIDIVRLLAGGKARTVRAQTGAWDPARPTEGAYAAQLTFDDRIFASLVYSGYAHFDSDELVDWVSELGYRKDRSRYGAARAALRARMGGAEETALKNERTYGATSVDVRNAIAHNHFGMVIASCDRADLRPMANGVVVYDDEREWVDEVPPPKIPRAEVIDEFCDAVAGFRQPIHSGEWAMATLEVCLAILQSARSGREVSLEHQVGVPS